MFDLKSIFITNFDRLFSIEALDFYNDVKNEDVHFIKRRNKNYPNTIYSQKGSYKKSILKVYDRVEKLRQKHNIPFSAIQNIEYPLRIEFSLRRDNCKFLDIRNLTGIYENVFLRYLYFLANRWNNYSHDLIHIYPRNIEYNLYLLQIISVSLGRIPHYNNLYKTPVKPIPYKSAQKNGIDYNFIAEFYRNASLYNSRNILHQTA